MTAAASPLLARFAALGGVSPALREAGMRALEGGLPTPRWEAWRFTPVERRLKPSYRRPAATRAAAADLPLAGFDAARLVLVDGRARPDLSDLSGLGEGVELRPLAELAGAPELGSLAPLDGQPFAALNAAGFADGLYLRVRRDRAAARPIHLASVAAGEGAAAIYPRLLAVLEAGARATLIESHGASGGDDLTGPVAEFALGVGAELKHVRLRDDGGAHLALTAARLEAGASYDSVALSAGGGLMRHETRIVLAGRGASCRLAGASVAGGRTHLDVTTSIEHAAPETRSRQLFKSVLAGRGRGVFQGRVLVRREAQKSDSHQLCRALLLSPEAEADAKPELEIYADDVKCGHGATVGELEAEPLFYLRSRGIDAAAARRLLIDAFVAEALDGIADESLRAACAALAGGWIGAAVAGDAA